MRRAFPFLVALVPALLHVAEVAATTRIALGNGDWTAPGTWSGGVPPQAGDLIIIPASAQVNVTSNNSYSGAAMRIQVYGALRFVGNGSKISMPCGSILEVMTPAAVVFGNGAGSSQTIRICGVTYWSVSDGPESGYSAWPVNATLPVELLAFTGTYLDSKVYLAWSTATESNSAHFEVQRSADARTFTPLTTVTAAGWSVVRIGYTANDDPPTPGTWYYRLVQHDLDGAVHELPAIAVRTGPAPGFTCAPVPASDHITITAGMPGTLIVSDINGNTLLEQALVQEQSTIGIAELPNGAYVLRVVHGDRSDAQRVLIAHE
jgi:hypothetical protein